MSCRGARLVPTRSHAPRARSLFLELRNATVPILRLPALRFAAHAEPTCPDRRACIDHSALRPSTPPASPPSPCAVPKHPLPHTPHSSLLIPPPANVSPPASSLPRVRARRCPARPPPLPLRSTRPPPGSKADAVGAVPAVTSLPRRRPFTTPTQGSIPTTTTSRLPLRQCRPPRRRPRRGRVERV